MLWLAGLSSVLFVCVFVLCCRSSGNSLAAFMGALCAWFFGTVGLSIRPQVLGYTLLTFELILLEAASRDRRALWLLPPLFAIWVNCHGSYLFGLAVLVVWWICSYDISIGMLKRPESPAGLGVILILCGAALCCNPVGARLLLYPFNVEFQQSTGLMNVEEWLPPDLRSGRGFAMIAAPGLLLLAVLARRAELNIRELLLIGLALLLAMRHVRMLFVFGIVISPILSRALSPALGKDLRREHPIVNALLMTAFAVAIFWNFPTPEQLREQVRRTSPVGAADYVRRAGLPGPMLNEYVFGGYLVWALPERKVFVDGRADVFDWTGVLEEYRRWATLSEDPGLLLEKRGVRLCLLSTEGSMARVMPYLPRWRMVYSDRVASVFVR
jgi:hypothetical protein